MKSKNLIHRNIKNYFNKNTRIKKFDLSKIVIDDDKYIDTKMDIAKLASMLLEFEGCK